MKRPVHTHTYTQRGRLATFHMTVPTFLCEMRFLCNWIHDPFKNPHGPEFVYMQDSSVAYVSGKFKVHDCCLCLKAG